MNNSTTAVTDFSTGQIVKMTDPWNDLYRQFGQVLELGTAYVLVDFGPLSYWCDPSILTDAGSAV